MDRTKRRIVEEIGADAELLDMPLPGTRNSVGGLTGVFAADHVLQVMCYLAQMERDRMRERQREGIEASGTARERGAGSVEISARIVRRSGQAAANRDGFARSGAVESDALSLHCSRSNARDPRHEVHLVTNRPTSLDYIATSG